MSDEPQDTPSGGPLAPCPLCGGQPFVNHIAPHEHGIQFGGVPLPPHEGSYTIECAGCGLGIIDDTLEAVTATWQRRTPTSSRERALLGEMAEGARAVVAAIEGSDAQFAALDALRALLAKYDNRDAATKESA